MLPWYTLYMANLQNKQQKKRKGILSQFGHISLKPISLFLLTRIHLVSCYSSTILNTLQRLLL